MYSLSNGALKSPPKVGGMKELQTLRNCRNFQHPGYLFSPASAEAINGHNSSMRSTLILIFSLVTLLGSPAFALNELEPFINFLRSTPAYMNGEFAFSKESILYQEGWSIVKIVPNQNIGFSFKEDYLEVRPQNAFYVKYAGMRVKIKSVTWTPSGMKTVSEIPADITGLSRGKVSREVAITIEGIFGQQLKRANALMKRVRSQKTLGSVFEIAKTVVYVFTRSNTSGVSLPNYSGEMGLNFLPPKDKALNLYGMRVGIRAHDHYRAGFRFTGDTNGIYPYSADFVSREGTDINQGNEFRAMRRLVLKTVSLSSKGIGLEMHLGASQIIGGVLSALEEAARRSGQPASCTRCSETASFPSIRIQIEGWVRVAIMAQIDTFWSYLPGFNISPTVLKAFKKSETCRVKNLSCLTACNRNNNHSDDALACKQSCDRTLNLCLKN